MKLFLISLSIFVLSNTIFCQNSVETQLVASEDIPETYSTSPVTPGLNIVYGQKHIFTVETPIDWTNDKELANMFGLKCLFYATADTGISNRSYIYALGIDKAKETEKLTDFVNHDLDKFRKNFPEFKYKESSVRVTGGIINGKHLIFSKLPGKYKEEVVYMETDNSFIVLSFSALSEENYTTYQPVFDSFIESFNYRGNNPESFLEKWEEYEKKKSL